MAGILSAPTGELASAATGDRGAQALLRLECRGVVQGVGLRPALQRLAARLGLSGSLSNAPDLVRLELQGRRQDLQRFLQELPGALPAAARLEPLQPQWLDAAAAGAPAAKGLRISAEQDGTANGQPISLFARALVADRAPCAACLRELDDPRSRRHGDPFLACSRCGPRYSIATAEPWLREHTTHARFPPCAACAREWADPADRRLHTETISCPCCGPRLSLLDSKGQLLGPTPPPQGLSASADRAALIAAAAELLERGQILALQGVGCFQLLVDAANPRAVARLRRRKRRPIKPFALLVAEPAWIGSMLPCPEPGGALLAALSSPAAPIVLLPRTVPHLDGGGKQAAAALQRDAPTDAFSVCAMVAPCNAHLGVMLPASALHLLLVRHFGRPLVCTSGNRSGEPLCTDPLEARQRLDGIADAFLIHDRPIARPLDESLLQLIDDRPVLLRAQLRPVSWNQSQITDCSHLVVLLRRRAISAADADQLIATTAKCRGLDVPALDGYRQMIQRDLVEGPRSQTIGTWASNQVYIALGTLMTCAALMGVDTCPIEGFSPPDYDRILGLEAMRFQTSVVCACGYRSASDKYAALAKVRYEASELIEQR